jgi:hypothetical protein
MKIKLIILLFITISGSAFPWGAEGHKLIAGKAMGIIKDKIEFFGQYHDYIAEHSIDADKRKDIDKTEGMKHYIDIDFYDEFLNGKMITDKNQLVKIYGDSVVTKIGLLPWATLQTFQKLTSAFREKDRDKILILTADLAHYVADAHQPFHTLLNYNGQLTSQNGIHHRFESIMVEKHLDELNGLSYNPDIKFIEEPRNYIFNYISNSFSLSEVIFAADKFASNRTGSTETDEYYRLLWLRTKYVCELQFKAAANSLASLIFTAWVDAGEPSISEIN